MSGTADLANLRPEAELSRLKFGLRENCLVETLVFPHLCVGFLFLILYPTRRLLLRRPLFSHTTLSHTIFHTQRCHTPSFATPSFTRLSHTIFVTHHLSHTPIFHTQFCHTHLLSHATLSSYTPSFTPTLSHTFFHTQRGTWRHLQYLHFAWQAWQAWRLATLTCVLRGNGGTCGTALALVHPWARLVARAPLHFAWPAAMAVAMPLAFGAGTHRAYAKYSSTLPRCSHWSGLAGEVSQWHPPALPGRWRAPFKKTILGYQLGYGILCFGITFLEQLLQGAETTFKMSRQGAIFPDGVLCMFFKFCFSRLGNAGRPPFTSMFFW